jgi:hypothetical protein
MEDEVFMVNLVSWGARSKARFRMSTSDLRLSVKFADGGSGGDDQMSSVRGILCNWRLGFKRS